MLSQIDVWGLIYCQQACASGLDSHRKITFDSHRKITLPSFLDSDNQIPLSRNICESLFQVALSPGPPPPSPVALIVVNMGEKKFLTRKEIFGTPIDKFIRDSPHKNCVKSVNVYNANLLDPDNL